MALAAPGARTAFHALTVVDRAPASADGESLAITFGVPPALREVFSFTAGQHVTLRAVVDGAEVRRSYSVCSTPAELHGRGVLRVGVRLLPGGVFSQHAARELVSGTTVDVLPPLGGFVLPASRPRRGRYAAIAAGSGVTPVLSLAATALAEQPGSTFAVVLGNRTAASTMFADELADLKDRYPDRFALTRLFSRERLDVGLAATHLDEPTLDGLLADVLVPAAVDQWFACGPYKVVEQARRALAAHGVPPEAVRSELFHAGPVGATGPAPVRDGAAYVLSVRLEGRTTEIGGDPGASLLDAALAARPELPYSCRTGVCGTCRVRVVAGAVRMPATWTLSDRERAEGYVLACRATPKSDRVAVDFDVV